MPSSATSPLRRAAPRLLPLLAGLAFAAPAPASAEHPEALATRAAEANPIAALSDDRLRLELRAPSDPSRVVSALALDSAGEQLLVIGSTACVATRSTLLLVDLSDPTRPRIAGRVPAPDRIVSLHAIPPSTLILELPRGALVALDVSDPASPRIVSEPPAASTQPGDGGHRDRLQRLTLELRPYFSLQALGGAATSLAYELNAGNGLLLRAEATALASPLWNVEAHLTLGYSGKRAAVGFTFGGGYPSIFRVGTWLRFGRLAGNYATLRIDFAYPMIIYPEGELDLFVRTAERWYFRLTVGGQVLPFYGPWVLFGGQRLLRGDGGPGTHAIAFGLGFIISIQAPIPGPIATVRYERRW